MIGTPTPFDWASDHIHLIGWPVVVTMAWKLRGAFERIVQRGEGVESKLDKIANNDLAHVQEALNEIKQNTAVMVALLQKEK